MHILCAASRASSIIPAGGCCAHPLCCQTTIDSNVRGYANRGSWLLCTYSVLPSNRRCKRARRTHRPWCRCNRCFATFNRASAVHIPCAASRPQKHEPSVAAVYILCTANTPPINPCHTALLVAHAVHILYAASTSCLPTPSVNCCAHPLRCQHCTNSDAKVHRSALPLCTYSVLPANHANEDRW